MKKTLMIFAVMLIIMTLICTTVSAATLGITCSTVGSDAKGERMIFKFRNVETGEELSRNINDIGINKFTDVPDGDYEAICCINKRNENIEYPIASMEKFFTVEGENAFYSFRVGNAIELKEGAKDDLEKAVKMDWLLLLSMVLALVLFVLWMVFAIKGRKNIHKKMIARFLFHLMFGFVGFSVGYFAVGGDMNEILVCIMGAGFPFGCAMAAYINYKIDMERGYYVIREGEGFGMFLVRMAFILAICALVGAIAMPVVLVLDIINIVKSKYGDFEE